MEKNSYSLNDQKQTPSYFFIKSGRGNFSNVF